jgi:hypothetical protein
MDRFGILGRLQSNWPGKFSMHRISFLERELRTFDNEVLDIGVTSVLRSSDFPPSVNALHSACTKAAKQIESKNSGRSRHKPGDMVDGERTFTPSEAADELIRIKEEFPEAFTLVATKDSMRDGLSNARLDLVVTSIYIKALRRCAALEPSSGVTIDDLATQDTMF